MELLLDVRTLALSNALLSLTMGCGLLVYASAHSSFRGLSSFGYGYLVGTVGFVLLALRGYVSDGLSVVLANVFVFSGILIGLRGFFLFYKIPHKELKKISAGVVVLLLSGFTYCVFVEGDMRCGKLLVSGTATLFSLYCAMKMFLAKSSVARNELRFIGSSVIVFFLVLLHRTVSLASGSVEYVELYNSSINAFILVFLLVYFVVICMVVSWSASKKLQLKLENQIIIDPLTRLYNRRVLNEFAIKQMSLAGRTLTSTAVVMIDIDKFKNINDKFGHKVGDDLLKQFASRLKSQFRMQDILVRLGGDEFIALLPNTSKVQAVHIAEKFRVSLETEPLLKKIIGDAAPVTSSFGVASYAGDAPDWASLLSHVDKALYRAKVNGRNRVEEYADEEL